MPRANINEARLKRLQALSGDDDADEGGGNDESSSSASSSPSSKAAEARRKKLEERKNKKKKKKKTPKNSEAAATVATTAATSATATAATAAVSAVTTAPTPAANVAPSMSHLSDAQVESFQVAMVKLRGRKVPDEVRQMMREMADVPDDDEITVHEFEAALVGSRWNLSLEEASACVCYMSGPAAKKVNFLDFADVIESKLSSKEEDENVRIQRQMNLLRRVSAGGDDVDHEQAKRRWGRMNLMASKAKLTAEKRKLDFAAKLEALSLAAKQQNVLDQERERAKEERLRVSHMGYREKSKYMMEKRKEEEEKRKAEALLSLKMANQKKFTGVLMPNNALYSGDVNMLRFSPGNALMAGAAAAAAPNIDRQEDQWVASDQLPLFNGNVQSFGLSKPFSDDVFTNGLRAQFSRNSPMARGQFETYEKHVSADGRPFFYSPRLKMSVWTLPPCSILVDRTAEDVEGGGEGGEGGGVPATGNDSEKIIFAAHPSWDQDITALSGLSPKPPKDKKKNLNARSPRARERTPALPISKAGYGSDSGDGVANVERPLVFSIDSIPGGGTHGMAVQAETEAAAATAEESIYSEKLAELLRGDGELAGIMRRLNKAFDSGGADPLGGLDLRGFKGRKLTKKMFRRQVKRCLGVELKMKEVVLIFERLDEDGLGTLEYNEFLLGLKGPKYSALSRIKDVLDNTRIHRDMRSFQGRSLDKAEFAFQCKIVLGLELLPSELNAVFATFDKDGGGTIDYGEILLEFTKKNEMRGAAGRPWKTKW